MHISRVASAAKVLLCLCLIASVALTGCSAGEVRKKAEVIEKQTQKAADTVATVDAAIAAAEALPESEQVKTIHDSLPVDLQPKFDAAVAKGQSALEAGRSISAAVLESAKSLLVQLASLKDQLKAAKDKDDATATTIAWALGAAFPVLLPFVGLFSHRAGQASGAAFVTQSVATGRAADDNFDKAFDGPAHDAMAKSINRVPRLAAVVRANKSS